MVDIDELRERLVGRELPGGSFSVPPYESWLMSDVLCSPPLPEGVLHPTYVFHAGMRGVGFDIASLLDLVHCRPEDGPMIGETDLRQVRPLRVGETLRGSARVVDLVRKRGRSGVFDLMRVETAIRDEQGAAVAFLANTYVFPRRS